MNPIRVPSMAGVGDALGSYAQGVLGGVVFGAASRFLGNGLVGGALSAALAGATLKGPAGQMVAVSMGVSAGATMDLLGIMGGGGGVESADVSI